MQRQGFTALVPVEELAREERDGRQLLRHKKDVGLVDANDNHVRVEGLECDVLCYICQSGFYDDTTGRICACGNCGHYFLQSCTQPVILGTEMDTWNCAVCRGDDTDVCQNCGGEWTIAGGNEKENNVLIQCSGLCATWWHQKCHIPAVPSRYSLPKADDEKWFCAWCTVPEVVHEDYDEVSGVHGGPGGGGKPCGREFKAPSLG